MMIINSVSKAQMLLWAAMMMIGKTANNLVIFFMGTKQRPLQEYKAFTNNSSQLLVGNKDKTALFPKTRN